MKHYYCVPTRRNKLKSNTSLEENMYFNFIQEITNMFRVYQVFRPKFLSKITKKQSITSSEFSHLSEKIFYRIKSPSLREWETFDCYSWMQSYHSDHILVIEDPRMILYVTCYYFIHIFIDDKNITQIDPILKKYNFCLTKSVSRSAKNKTIYTKPRKLSNQQVLKLIEKQQYKLLVEFFKVEEDFLSSISHSDCKVFNLLTKKHFFITLWDHWIMDNQEFKKLIVEYFSNSFLLKTQPDLMQQKQVNEDKLLEFLIWLSSKDKSYRIYLDNQKLILRRIYQQDLINNFYMGARLGSGYSLYFPKTKILINTINEDYCMEVFLFDKNKKIETKIQKIGLYALK